MKNIRFLVLLLVGIVGVYAKSVDRTPFVVNGQFADYVPHNAYILFMTEQLAGFFGGGSLISNRHILTAAQNILGYSIWDIGLGGNSIFANQVFYRSRNAVMHPQFNATTRQNDIGIIFLPNTIDISGTLIRRIPLSPAATSLRLPLENEQGYVVGYGNNRIPGPNSYLLQGFQRVNSETRCKQFYQVQSDRFCAEDALVNACNGDIGAGFVVHINNQQILTGIASAIMDNCSPGKPTLYTRVQHYLDWIQLITGPLA
ncbi:chymotrypsin-like [Wyeomyia smithii]|uniref:chymotrypsin-like n=1 Tax=Wyeomyia smithii TaxID=174621 RepID=UPI0024681F14|nr:chymotrypsin-like [Wyeomyia smithii]